MRQAVSSCHGNVLNVKCGLMGMCDNVTVVCVHELPSSVD